MRNAAYPLQPRGAAVPVAAPIAPSAAPPEKLYRMRVRDIWEFIKTQPASFWFINIYLFFEYVRPQQIYREIDVIPWAWSALWLAFASLIIEGAGLRRMYFADKMLAAFSLMVLIGCFTAEWTDTAFSRWSDYYAWVFIYLLITNIITNEKRFIVFLLAFLIHSTKMSQHGFRTFVERGGSFSSVGASGAPGWFQNSGEFGIQMCIFMALSVYFIQALKPYWSRRKLWLFLFMPVSASISIVASSSRGAVIGLAPVVLWMLIKSKKRIKSLALVSVICAAVWILLPAEQKGRFSEMGEDKTSLSRLAFWERGMDMMENHPLTGIGYKNWMRYSMAYYPPYINTSNGQPMWQLPHNIFIEVGAELGYTGLLLFLGLVGATLYTNAKTRKLSRNLGGNGKFAIAISHGLDAGLFGYLVAGFFVTVFYYPFFWINYAFTVALHHIIVTRVTGGNVRMRGLTVRP